ncbi:MAG: SDR family oxidoreductase [Anaerolineae bacterium]|nr:MAG: SDR family oxidoreductase [Anaerolineae bacterium]
MMSADSAPARELADRPLRGRSALVTGASRNLGAVTAQRLAAGGADVAIGYLGDEQEEQQAAQVVAAIERQGVNGYAVKGDLAQGGEALRVVEQVGALLGRDVDILVNNAGPFSGEPLTSLSEADWDLIMNVNLKAAYLTTQAVVPGMKKSGWGRIVNLSAGSAFIRNHSVYGLAKAGVITLTEELALELGPEITVNAVAPGQIAESAPDISEIDPTFVDRAIARSPSGRLVTRAEVAELIAWLCDPAADMITGHTIPIDGGWRLNRF